LKKYIKVLYILFLSFCCLSLSACSSLNNGLYIHTDGTIEQVYSIVLDRNALTQAGIDANDVLDHMDTMIQNYESDLLDGKDTTGVHFDVQKENNTRTISIKFDNINVYNYIYDIDPSENPEPTVIHGIFSNKRIIFDGQSLFSSLASSNVYTQMFDYITNTYLGGNVALATQYLQNISVFTTRIYPSVYRTRANANYHKTNNGYDIYIWESTLGTELSTSPQNIQIWQTSYSVTNRLAWYGTALIITIIAGVILFVVLSNKQKHSASTQQNTQNTDSNDVLPPALYIENIPPTTPTQDDKNNL